MCKLTEQGLFIVFEGVDGSGTSTQANLLEKWLIARGKQAIISPEPTNGLIGRQIRAVLRGELSLHPDRALQDNLLAYLFAADRQDHLCGVAGVFAHLRQGINVICPRYFFSSMAYNDFHLARWLNHHFPLPDLLVYLDLDPEVAIARIRERGESELYETAAKLTEVRANYTKAFSYYYSPGRTDFIVLDAAQSAQAISEEIVAHLEEHYNPEQLFFNPPLAAQKESSWHSAFTERTIP